MSTEVWNLFDLFVVIETRINFSAEFLYTDDPRLKLRASQLSSESELSVQPDRDYFSQRMDSSRSLRATPPDTDLGARRKDSTNESECLFSNVLVPRDRYEAFALNRCTRNYKLKTFRAKSARVAETRRGQRLEHHSKDSCGSPVECEDPAPMHINNELNKLRSADKAQSQESGYTNRQLVILWLNSLVLFGFLLRLTLNSWPESRTIGAEGVHEVSRARLMNLAAEWQEFFANLLCGDLFARFTNRRMVNMVAAGLLVPSAALRVIRIRRYLSIHWSRNWFIASKKFIESLTSLRLFTIEAKEEMSGLTDVTLERLNIVQTDLCYLNSIHTTLYDWYQMLTKSWFHEHKFGSFLQEREMLTKICHDAHKTGHQSFISTCDLITKMYYYNLINFDGCYVKYFRQTAGKNINADAKRETMAARYHRLAIGKWTPSEAADQDQNQKAKSASGDCCAKRKKWPSGESDKKKIFVSKPLHRMDLTEMGWLLAALALLYGLGALTLAWEALFSFFVHLNIKAFSDISPGRMLIELRLFMTSFALTRWLLINLLNVIIMLTVFDLYQFFACCLICLSRARYLMFSLARMSDYCQVASHLLDQEQRLLDRMANKSNQASSNEIPNELAAILNSGKKLNLAAKSRGRENHSQRKTSRISPASISAVRELNTELECMMNLVVIVQHELADLKKFFSLYLNLELAFKSLCMTFCICALLDSNNIFEILYLSSILLTCTMPIFITMITAAFIENQFRGVCRNLDRIMMMGGSIMSVSNLRQAIQLTNFLGFKANRSFEVVGNFSLSLRSLLPILAWIATGVVMIRRERPQQADRI